MTTSVKMSNLAHEASLLEFDGGNSAEQPAPVPPAPIQSRVPTPIVSAIEKPPPTVDTSGAEILTNETVVKLVKAGLSDDVIAAMVNTQSGQYTATPSALIALKQAGVSDRLILAIVNKGSGSARLAHSTQPLQKATPAAEAANTPPACTRFTVVTQDTLNNIKQGLTDDDVKWFQKSFAKKFPNVCYAAPGDDVRITFYITVTPDVYHGTRIVTQTSRTPTQVSGTVTNQNGETSQVQGTAQTTTTSSTAVPYSVDYGIYTLSVERRLDDTKFEVLQRFRQKGLYSTLYGIPLGGRGHHPVHAVIEDATKWLSAGGLSNTKQRALP